MPAGLQVSNFRLPKNVLVAACAAIAFFIHAANAQQRPDAGQILQQTTVPAAAARPDTQISPPKREYKPGLSAPPGLRVTVKAFRVTGSTVFAEQTLQDAAREFVGRDLDIDGLNDAATAVRQHYIRNGYFLVEAYLPRQEIRDGVVEIAVIEGRIGKTGIRQAAGARLSKRLVDGILDTHLKEGELITETGLERPILLIGDLPGAVASSQIRPSRDAIGAADVEVDLAQEPGLISGSVDYDNFGNRFVGQNRLGFSLNLSNPLGQGDQLSLRHYSTDESSNRYTSLAYLIPVGYLGTRVGVSYSALNYRLAKDFTELQAHGDASAATIYLTHPFIRTRNSNLIGQLSYDHKKLNDRVESTATNEERRIDALRGGVVGDFRDAFLGGAFNAYTLLGTGGKLAISPATSIAADQFAGGRKTMGHFGKTNYDFRRLQHVTANGSLLLSINGQFASKNLASAEKFSLGGPNSVRAYPVGEATADTGYVATAEYRYRVPGFKPMNGDVTVLGFYDQGWVKLNQNSFPTDAANNRHLSGYGIGASFGREADFIVRMSAAWRNENEAPTSDTAKRVPRIWAQAIKWF